MDNNKYDYTSFFDLFNKSKSYDEFCIQCDLNQVDVILTRQEFDDSKLGKLQVNLGEPLPIVWR